MTAADLARAFHEAYERLAPSFGYETRRASAVPWEDVPEPNRSLMIAVAGEVLSDLAAELARLRREVEEGDRFQRIALLLSDIFSWLGVGEDHPLEALYLHDSPHSPSFAVIIPAQVAAQYGIGEDCFLIHSHLEPPGTDDD